MRASGVQVALAARVCLPGVGPCRGLDLDRDVRRAAVQVLTASDFVDRGHRVRPEQAAGDDLVPGLVPDYPAQERHLGAGAQAPTRRVLQNRVEPQAQAVAGDARTRSQPPAHRRHRDRRCLLGQGSVTGRRRGTARPIRPVRRRAGQDPRLSSHRSPPERRRRLPQVTNRPPGSRNSASPTASSSATGCVASAA